MQHNKKIFCLSILSTLDHCSGEGEVLLLCVYLLHITYDGGRGGFILHKIHSSGDVNKLGVQHINFKLGQNISSRGGR